MYMCSDVCVDICVYRSVFRYMQICMLVEKQRIYNLMFHSSDTIHVLLNGLECFT